VEYLDIEKRIVNPDVLTEGRYIRPPSTKLFKYKRTLQSINLAGADNVWCLTSEGLNMQLDVLSQYQIIKENVFDIFAEFGEEAKWNRTLSSLMSRVIIDVCANTSGENFYFNRGQVERDILASGKQAFIDAPAYATLELVQLTNVLHPPEYQEATREKQEVDQEQERLLSARQQNVTDVQTNLLKAAADAQIAYIRALGVVQATLVEANLAAQAEIQKWTQRTLALKAVKEQLGNITNAELIDQYIRYISLVGLSTPVINIP